MQQTITTSERQYTVSYYKPGGKAYYGLNVSVTGDKKAKVLREARQMLEQVQSDAMEVHKRFFGDKPISED